MGRIFDSILKLHGAAAVALIFVVPALESSAFVGFLFPGELAVLLGGVLAFQGRIPLGAALAATIAGAIIGDSVGYAVGAKWGQALFETRVGKKLFRPSHRSKAEELIRRRGGSAVLIGRFTALLRVMVPGLSGMSKMPYGTFLAFNVAGGVLWAGGFTLLGYFGGNAWRQIEHVAARASGLLAIGLVLVALIVFGARRVSRNEDRVRAWWLRQMQRPRVAAFRRRFRVQIAFARARMDPAGAFGLYLTIGLSVVIALGWGFGSAVQDLFAGEELALVDAPVERFFLDHQAPVLTHVMRWVTALGGFWVVAGLLLVGSALAVRRARSVRPGAFLFAAVWGGYLIERALKLLVHRLRPVHGIARSFAYSFPSGHTVGALTLYGGVAFIVCRLASSWRLRVWSWVLAVIIAAGVGVSRLYLGVHYASDVVAGAALGGMWLGACSTAWVAWDRMSNDPSLRGTRRKAVRQILKWGLFGLSIGILIHVVLLAAPGIDRSASALRRANIALVLLALGCEIGANGCLAQVYRRALQTLGPTIRYRPALRVSMAMFTVGHVLPAGGAAAGVYGAHEMSALGADPAAATASVVLGGTVGMATLGLIVFFGATASLFRGDLSPAYAALVGLVLVVLLLVGAAGAKVVTSGGFRRRIFNLVERLLQRVKANADVSKWREAFEDLTGRIHGVRSLAPIMRWSAANWLLDAAALWILFWAFGYRLHIGVLVVGYGLANLVTALPLTPGGLGFVEAGLAGIYTAFGAPSQIAIIAVLSYRLLSYWLPVLAGIPAYARSGRKSPPVKLADSTI